MATCGDLHAGDGESCSCRITGGAAGGRTRRRRWRAARSGQGVRPRLLRSHALPAPLHRGALAVRRRRRLQPRPPRRRLRQPNRRHHQQPRRRIPSPSTTGTTESPPARSATAPRPWRRRPTWRRAAGRLDGVEQGVGPEVLWRVRDAQTWLSAGAAMTYEDTCADALRPAASAPTPVRAELRAGVRRAMQHTSIALALVHMLIRNSA